ncbi:RING-H2 finger protein ATL77-like [Drosophila obscura]|uniref:RING-H2 finger protein ATL77-like n=1 Tax=Drosophila obscura TaxID=7282 RepID=UPI001BB178C2|nr:RING-H2 finger protein ATL77-like [Drosophila obscura]
MGKPEDDPAPGSAPQCQLCGKTLAAAPTLKTKCGHEFHKNCIEAYVKTHTTCPTCKAICVEKGTPHNTRAQAKKMEAAAMTSEIVSGMVTQAISTMQEEVVAQLTDRMAEIIQSAWQLNSRREAAALLRVIEVE